MTSLLKVLSKEMTEEELRYYITSDEIKYFWGVIDKDESRAIAQAFRYGFEKGRRCERAAQKRAKKAANPQADQSKGLTANEAPANGYYNQHTTKAEKAQGVDG